MNLSPKKTWKPVAWVLEDNGVVFDNDYRGLLAGIFHGELDRIRDEWLAREEAR